MTAFCGTHTAKRLTRKTNNMKNNLLKFGLMTFFAMFYSLPLMANPGGDGGVGDEDEEPLPIDNWMLILLLAAIALGVYFTLKYNKKAVA